MRWCYGALVRTTLTIDDDVLALARTLAEVRGSSVGSALSVLARRGFRRTEAGDTGDVPTFRVARDAAPITSEDVRAALTDWP